MTPSQLPRTPGSYVLLLAHPGARSLQVGRLGCFDLSPGRLAYVGSARGPGGLAARIGRHLRRDAPLRWHLDYLKQAGRIDAAWLAGEQTAGECDTAVRLGEVLKGPLAGFGASDCACDTHLYRVENPEQLEALVGELGYLPAP